MNWHIICKPGLWRSKNASTDHSYIDLFMGKILSLVLNEKPMNRK